MDSRGVGRANNRACGEVGGISLLIWDKMVLYDRMVGLVVIRKVVIGSY